MPSSCHSDSNFLFPPLLLAPTTHLIPSVSPFLASPSLPLLFSLFAVEKPSNEIHPRQDGSPGPVLAFFFFFCFPLICFVLVCFPSHILMCSTPSDLLSFPSVLCAFLPPSLSLSSLSGPPFSSRSYSSISPS